MIVAFISVVYTTPSVGGAAEARGGGLRLPQRADTSVSGTRQRHTASPVIGKMHCSHALQEAGQHLVEVLECPVKFLGGDGERWRDA